MILKPVRSFLRDGDRLRQRTAEVVESEEELVGRAAAFGRPLIVQRYEPEPRIVSCAGVVTADGVVALAVALYVRTWPVAAGPSSYSQTIEPPPGLVPRLESLLGTLGWRGLFQLQFLELDGRLATLDFNARIFGSLALAVAAGANLPAIWAESVLGRRVAQVTARAGVRYRWEEGDAHYLVWQLRRRRLRAAAGVLVPRRRSTRAYFRASDPAPLAAGIAAAIGRRRRNRRGCVDA